MKHTDWNMVFTFLLGCPYSHFVDTVCTWKIGNAILYLFCWLSTSMTSDMDATGGQSLYPLHRTKTLHLVCIYDTATHSFLEIISWGIFYLFIYLYFEKGFGLTKPCIQVRHAQGIHNVEGEKDHDAYLSYDLFDANITPLGWKQVAASLIML